MSRKLIVALFVLLACSLMSARTYYVDCAGNDKADASSPDRAWKTLEKASATKFAPGDKLLLRSGCLWKESLTLRGRGEERSPIIVDRYGDGAPPHVDGNAGPYALSIEDGEFWEVSRLRLTNDAAQEGSRLGVLVVANNTGKVHHHIYLRQLDVYNVRGKLGAEITDKRTGGIGFEVRGKSNPTRFDDVLVEDCSVHDLDNTGIYTWSEAMAHPRHPRWQELRWTRVAIRHNTLRNIGKNAMAIRGSLAPVIEHNLVQNSSQRTHGNAIYVFASKDALVQFNEVSGTKYDGLEGAAYDSDFNTEGTIIQYNYSHDNGGGLLNFCSNPKSQTGGYNDGTIVRYNISRDETHRVIAFDGPATNAQIYNNTIYLDRGFSPAIIEFDTFGKTPGYADHVTFRNNIIYNLGEGKYLWGKATNVSFEANCFFGNHPESEPSDPKKITADPQFKGSSLKNPNGLTGFALASASPCASSGVAIDADGARDYFGRPVPSVNPDRGAVQGTAAKQQEKTSTGQKVSTLEKTPVVEKTSTSNPQYDLVPDVVFANPDGIKLKADLYLPKGDGPFLGAVFLHGGGWSSGDRKQLRRQAAFLAERGVVGMAIEYRLSGQAKYPAAVEDSREAVRWLRKNASTYHLDPTRIVAIGSSAGGHLASMLGVQSEKDKESQVAAVVAFNPVLDLTQMSHRNDSVAKFLGKPCDEVLELCREASPALQVSPATVPFLVLHGTADETVPYKQATEMVKLLKQQGVHATLFTADGAPHTFWAQQQWLDQTNRAAEQFLREIGLLR